MITNFQTVSGGVIFWEVVISNRKRKPTSFTSLIFSQWGYHSSKFIMDANATPYSNRDVTAGIEELSVPHKILTLKTT